MGDDRPAGTVGNTPYDVRIHPHAFRLDKKCSLGYTSSHQVQNIAEAS